jgi:hypothetical protein
MIPLKMTEKYSKKEASEPQIKAPEPAAATNENIYDSRLFVERVNGADYL